MKTLNQIIHKAVKLVAVAVIAGSVSSVVRADAPVISGFIDTTYNYNFNRPQDNANQLRAFDYQANTFALQSAQVQLAGTLGAAGYVIKVLGGSDAGVIKRLDNGAATSTQDVLFQEAYGTYACPLTGINVKFGKFATPEGIEVTESKDDATISRGYLYNLAEPITHTGVMLTRPFGKVEVGFGVVNGWDNTIDNNGGKSMIGKLGLNLGDLFALTLSGITGPEQNRDATGVVNADGRKRNSYDATLVSKISPMITLNLQGNYGDEKVADGATTPHSTDKWAGAGIQPVIKFTDKFSLGSRLEYFSNSYGSRVSAPAGFLDSDDHYALTNITVTPAFKMTDNMTFRLEYRYDTANKKFFVDDKGNLKDSDSTVAAQWLVTF